MAPADAGGCRLEAAGDGRYRVQGDLGFGAAVELLASGVRSFGRAGPVEVDLSGVTDADSAGLAVLLEWTRLARLGGWQIAFSGMPDRLADLARIGGVSEFLPAGGGRTADSG